MLSDFFLFWFGWGFGGWGLGLLIPPPPLSTRWLMSLVGEDLSTAVRDFWSRVLSFV